MSEYISWRFHACVVLHGHTLIARAFMTFCGVCPAAVELCYCFPSRACAKPLSFSYLQMCGRNLSRVICLSSIGANRVHTMPFTLRNIGGDLDTKRAIEQAVIRGSQVIIFPLRRVSIFKGGGMELLRCCQYFTNHHQTLKLSS